MFGKRYDVFLSYSRADTDRVAPLRDELRRLGYRVFFDVESIDPASPWRERLRQAIRSSRLLVLCWSENARGSDYIDFEYMQADALHQPICPWLLDKTPLPPMLEAQAIANPSAAEVAARLKPILGWPRVAAVGRGWQRRLSRQLCWVLRLGISPIPRPRRRGILRAR